MMRLIVLGLLITLSGFAYAAPTIEVIQLQNRTADEMIPVLRPLLSESESMTGTGYQLILKANQSTVEQIQEVLSKLDRAPRALLLSVSNESALKESGYHVDGSVVVRSDDGKVVIGESPGRHEESGVSVRGDQYRTRRNRDQQNQLRITEGKPAFILREDLRVVPARAPVYHGYHRYGEEYTTTISSNQNGVYVTARVIDEQQVNLEISPVFGDDRGYYDENRIQTANTVIRARVGEWTYLGGTSQQQTRKNTGILSRGKQTSLDDQQIYVKVELVQ